MKEEKKEKEFINPIDPDKIAENPHLLPYAHTVGGAVIKPMDKGRTKGLSVQAMQEQTKMQLSQIEEQIKLLAMQAKKLQDRVSVSEMIYGADMNFKPLINHIYHLYQRENGEAVLSMIGPGEWGRAGHKFHRFLATVKLLADHTWEILKEAEPEDH
ncbi:DUF2452 domain-containing protein [Saprospira sp. CCB-QB6]|uniref:DUF2452 domain-containing protein n=1 Tax=Saprospira sp. CCB-QB6 TaxID=3023936 RepID=UPI00234B27FC|nr:DUF2452 domain-containing protein [Saprospira sp. CCB-QB6]WCL80770.1 DUF2452 domain-containing protein [Saprospira sp. CCB-QB6]